MRISIFKLAAEKEKEGLKTTISNILNWLLHNSHNKWGFGVSTPELWRNMNPNKQLKNKQVQTRDQETLNTIINILLRQNCCFIQEII